MERLDSNTKDIQFFVQALDAFRDENGNFHQDLEPPTSFLELDRSGTNVLETLRTRKTPFEFENYQIAEPISLISADTSQKLSTEGSPMAQNNPTRPANIEPINLNLKKAHQQQSKNSSAKQSPRLMLQQKQVTKSFFELTNERIDKTSETSNEFATNYKIK